MSLYELLGVEPSANTAQLKAAYRRRARELHPDVNRSEEAGGEMRRLNEAWAVLSEPAARRQYDEALAAERPPSDSGGSPSEEARARPTARYYAADIIPAPLPGWARLFRPSVLLLVVLGLIFVGTAYAAHPGSGGTTAPRSSTSTTAGSGTAPGTDSAPARAAPTTAGPNLVGSCILNQPTSVQLVPCSQTPNSLVVGVVPAQVPCPAGTTGLLLQGQSEQVCAQADGP